ncbi:SGNH hydrolase [Marasmius fiardii PR-910]|nr:SGNH hydrolase [Marasmius fiardii PR-910]
MASTANKRIENTNSLIHYHGRWDSTPGTWWAGSGLTLNIENLKSLQLELGQHTTTPVAALGIIFNQGVTTTVNVSQGINDIPFPAKLGVEEAEAAKTKTVVKLNVEGWQDNRIDLRSVVVNADAVLHPYQPSPLAFQFIGDSLTSGQFLPNGINDAWPFLTAQHFGAEYRINSQPGAALTDIVSYGNQHGVSFQFFRTEDTGYFWAQDHNYTTPWNFARDLNPPTSHVIIHIGANDASQNVTLDAFVETYGSFITRLRTIYPVQPIFVFSPWGWPNADGNIYGYYEGAYQRVVDARHALHDRNVFLVNTTGWVTYQDVFPDNVHPTPAGHQKIANELIDWLKKWGL